MSDFESIYKAAIALNNTAIYLVQHGKYNDAGKILQDAMKCSQAFCNGGGDPMDDDAVPSKMLIEDCELALQGARDRKCAMQREVSTTFHSKPQKNILVVSDQDDPLTVYETLEENPTLICCVTIDPVEKFDIHDIDRLKVETSFIVYNFGVVNRCIANRCDIQTSLKRRDDHYDVFCASVQILEMTRCVTMNHLINVSCKGTHSFSVSPSLILTAVLTLTNLYQMSVECGFITETQEYYKVELAGVLTMLSERESFLISQGYQVSVALAA